MRNIEQNEWRSKAIWIALLTMLIGLLISRSLLSVSLFAFLALVIFNRDLITQCRNFIRNPFLIALSFLFLIPMISGLWSADLDEYLDVLRVKLPLLLLPFAFAGNWKLKEKQWQQLALAFIFITVLGCLWSLWAYLQDPGLFHEGYLRAKTLPTPMGNDHVRFSWLVSIAVLTSVLLLAKNNTRNIRAILFLAIALLVVYLHVLSARTGLVLLYLMATGYLVYQFKVNKIIALTLFGIVLVLSSVAWLLFPTLQNRLRYNIYDISHIRDESYRTGLSDANRIYSLKAGWHILQLHPLGIGAGDIPVEMNKWYRENIPGMQESDKLYPSSEWMVYGNMAGWPGVILFTLVIIFPLFLKDIQYRFFWIALNIAAGLSFVIETSLEIQYGVFIYVFFLLWWWKWLRFEKT